MTRATVRTGVLMYEQWFATAVAVFGRARVVVRSRCRVRENRLYGGVYKNTIRKNKPLPCRGVRSVFRPTASTSRNTPAAAADRHQISLPCITYTRVCTDIRSVRNTWGYDDTSRTVRYTVMRVCTRDTDWPCPTRFCHRGVVIHRCIFSFSFFLAPTENNDGKKRARPLPPTISW